MIACDCDWLGEADPIQPCGGCDRDVRLYRDIAVHVEGKHFHRECVLRVAADRAACVLDLWLMGDDDFTEATVRDAIRGVRDALA